MWRKSEKYFCVLNSILSFGLFVDFFFFFKKGKHKVLLKQIFEQQIGDETPAK
jgi:hypothetical protein